MAWSSDPQDPVRPARAGWYSTPPTRVRPYAPGWYTPIRERGALLTGAGTLSGGVKAIQRVGVTLNGGGEVTATTTQKYPVPAHFASEDTSLTGTLISGLSAWWYTYSAYPVAFSGGGELVGNMGANEDGLSAWVVGPRYLTDDPQGSTGTLGFTMMQKYLRTAAFNSAGILAAQLSGEDGLHAFVAPGVTGAENSVGTLAAAIWQKYAMSPALSAVGALTASWKQKFSRSAALSGGGALFAWAWQYTTLAAALSGSGALSAAARMYQSRVTATLSGAGTFGATMLRQYVRPAALSGGGSLSASSRMYQATAKFPEIAEGGGDYEDTGIPIYSWGGGNYSTEEAYTGTHSWKWTGGGGSWNGPFLRQAGTSPFSPGRRIDLRVKVKPHASNNTSSGYVVLAARFFTDEARTTYIDSTWATINNSALSAGWNTLENLGIIAPAGTLSVEMWVLASSDTPGGNMYYVDAASVVIDPLLIGDGALSATTAGQVTQYVTANFGGSGTLSATAGYPSHAPELQSVTATGAYTYTIPWWCNYVDVICLGGGNGGRSGGAANANGGGGKKGVYASATVTRGTTIARSVTSITGSVGIGGLGGIGFYLNVGNPGGASTAAATGWGGISGAGGNGDYQGSTDDGEGAGNLTYNGQTYVGGATQTVLGTHNNPSHGYAPGGGGAGTKGGVFSGGSPGGTGGRGQVWFYAYQ